MTDSASCDPTSVSAASLVRTSASAEACCAASISACMVRMPANRSVHDSASMRPSSRSMASSWSWISGVLGRKPAHPVQDVLGFAEAVAGLVDQVRPDVDGGADGLAELADLAGLLIDLGGEALELEAADLQPLGVGKQQQRHGGQHVDEVRDVGQAARRRGRRLPAGGDGHDLAGQVRARRQPVGEHGQGGEHQGEREPPPDRAGGLDPALAPGPLGATSPERVVSDVTLPILARLRNARANTATLAGTASAAAPPPRRPPARTP